MADFAGFVLAALAGGGLSAVLLTIAAVLGKSHLAHWLNKDIERIKSQHQKDLEAYKVSLIAEAERVKASQDVQKSIAVRIAEMKFDAIKQVQETCSQLGFLLLYAQAARGIDRNVDYGEMAAQAGAFHGAVIKAKPFLTAEEQNKFLEFSKSYTERLNYARRSLSQSSLIDVDPVLCQLLEEHQCCEQIVFRRLDEMLKMIEPTAFA